jgi:glycosyltransferase involved in cell wall biosynthesis
MSDTPTVSVVMPTLDISEYLPKTIPAILEQTFSDFELLILDGGSTDGTVEYISALDDQRIRTFKNCGSIVKSLNKGIEESRGKYIARADGDSVPKINWLEKCVDFLETNPDYAVVGTQAKRVEPDGTTYITKMPTSYEEITFTLHWKNPIIHPSVMIRKRALEDIGVYRERHWEDYDLFIRLVSEYKIANLSEALITEYIRKDSIVNSTSIMRWVLANLRCSFLAIRTTDHTVIEILRSGREIVIPALYTRLKYAANSIIKN